ncbi:uncharacterized protein LOC129773257 [Toxorhynchites rutilus septentrionalis]|uniref:uncharacterized protein LOC129773257 n=1 Tax=Toxorhynchites rutilus septentrionalis TaxID=329112 RepID=UPI002478C57F|nr:uncharacterized protein LOC129773257 [Toxorhynchites rutilus septentrionalis]
MSEVLTRAVLTTVSRVRVMSTRSSSSLRPGGMIAPIRINSERPQEEALLSQFAEALMLDNAHWTSVEQVWISLALKDRKLYLCGVYIPPDRIRDATLIEEHFHSVSSVLSSTSTYDDIVILGGFNLPGIKWRSLRNGFQYPDPSLTTHPAIICSLLNTYSAATLRQINNIGNENGRMLDLCFVSQRDYAPVILEALAPLVKHVPHHPPLLLSVNEVNTKALTTFESTTAPVNYNFFKADIESMCAVLSSVDWNSVLGKDDIDLAVQTYSHILGYVIDMHVPKQYFTGNRVPWMTKELRQLKTLKRAVLSQYSRAKVCRSANHVVLPLREHYRRLNQMYKSKSRRSFAKHQTRILQKLKSNPKAFWKYVNDQRKECGLPSSMFYKEEVATDTEDIRRLFALKFSGMFDNATLSPEEVSTAAGNVPVNEVMLSRISVNDECILKAVAKLKSSM